MLNAFTRGLLRLGRLIPATNNGLETLSQEELRTAVNEVTGIIPRRHLRVLVGLLELENIAVEDVMVPRAEIVGLDLEAPWPDLLARLITTCHTRIPVYREDIDRVEGILHVRDTLPLLVRPDFDRASLQRVLRETYFIPEGTPLHIQLLHFQHHRQGLGLVVNEYGDIRGLITLEDILEEVVDELAPEPASGLRDIYPEPDGSYLVDGGASVREINRQMGWKLPTDGPKTLNGLILEQMEAIPTVGTSFLLAGYPMEVVQIGGNVVKTVRVKSGLRHEG
jgi:Mg2+/Co2+ transporter CorB